MEKPRLGQRHGQTVHLKQCNGHNALENNYEEGVWIGHERGSNEVLVATPSGVVKAWSIKRLPEEER